MTPVTGLAALAPQYDVLLCDVWGVIHNGRESFPAACAALARFKLERGPVILISNAPRPHPPIVDQLDSLGVPREAWSCLVTSGDVTRTLLAERAPGPVWTIGPERDEILYEGLGLERAGPSGAAFISVTGPYDDEIEGPEDYRERLADCATRGLELICANPDLVVQRGDRLIFCAGALAELYVTLGGSVAMGGKPFGAIYDQALREAGARMDAPLERRRVLCIGDGLPTDVKGANNQGLDVLFVASGIHGADATGPGGLNAPAAAQLMADKGLAATWAIADLVW